MRVRASVSAVFGRALADGTVMPSRFSATGIIDAEGRPVEVEVDVAVDSLGVPECLAVTQRPVEGYPLVGSRLPMKRLVHEALVAVGSYVESASPTPGGGRSFSGMDAGAARRKAQELSASALRPQTPHSPYSRPALEEVARISRAARAKGVSEAGAVADELRVSAPTAGRYRRRARADGLLD